MTHDPYQLFEYAPAAYVVFARDGLILEANTAFLRSGRPRSTKTLSACAHLPSLLTVGGRIYFETHLMPHLDLNDHLEEVALEVAHSAGARAPVLLSANVHRETSANEYVVRAVLFEARERRRYEADLLMTTRAAEAAERHAHDLSRTLQKTLIPPTPPVIPGLDVAAEYRPAGDGHEVGGDFYDVFNVGPDTWFVVLGDVAGKGIPAATVTSLIRHAVRGLAMQHIDPSSLLRALDRALQNENVERFCTLVALRLTHTENGWLVHGSLGGHPLPVLAGRDGTARHLGVPGSLVGILDEPDYTTFSHALGPDEFLVLYTDGITEAKHDREQFGTDRLLELIGERVRDAGAGAAELTESVVRAGLEFQDGDANDDIAVLTLHPTAATSGGASSGEQSLHELAEHP